MKKNTITIATRKSPLAMWQAHYVSDALCAAHPGLEVELLAMTTRGDKILDAPLAKVGGKGLFVKELERAILDGQADIAVHSMKDVPMDFPEGLGLAVICEREDPADALVSNEFNDFESLPQGARLGTSSLRRQCQLRRWRPDLQIIDLRGNVGTRLGKLDAGDYDAIVLAAAGLRRLELESRIRQSLPYSHCLPAGGQGAVGVECRLDDEATLELLSCLHHQETASRVLAERKVNARLGGSCQVPIASFAELRDDNLYLRALVGQPDGSNIIMAEDTASAADPEELGLRIAEELLSAGAGKILEALV